MSSPAADREDIRLYNLFAHTPRDDVGAQRRLVFRLGNALRSDPGNLIVRTALAGAYLQSGDRDQGLGLLDAVFHQRAPLPRPVRGTIGWLYGEAGNYSRATEVARELVDEPSEVGNVLLHSFAAGDLDLFERVRLRYHNQIPKDDEADAWAAILDAHDLRPVFLGHQQVVAEVLSGHQVRLRIEVVSEEGEAPMIAFDHIVVDDVDRLSEQLFDALWDYHERQGRNPGEFVGVLVHTILPLE